MTLTRSGDGKTRGVGLSGAVASVKGDDMEESQSRVSSAIAGEDEYAEFWPAGTFAKGQFSCTACGNRVTVHQVLPRCMVCGERLWERADWSPFARSEALR